MSNALKPAPIANGETLLLPPGLAEKYNHDLNPADEVLISFPNIRDGLKDKRLWLAFERYDQRAKESKRRFHRLGLCALILGSFPLLFASVRMGIGEWRYREIGWIGILADACGALAVTIIVTGRLGRFRTDWCQAMFCRERLRQWHFQKFMDGQLISQLAHDKPAYETELTRRWGILQAEFDDGHGYMKSYLASGRGGLMHERTPYPNNVGSAMESEILQALWVLRFEHQVRYSKRKVGPNGELQDIADWSEWVAKTSLFVAVIVTAASFACSFAVMVHLQLPVPYASEGLTRFLGGLALFFAVLSAATRAYRAGFTLPDEVESYEDYADRVREIKSELLAKANFAGKIGCLQEIEEEAVEELRRFLRLKTKATFVF